jgi:hypothetical protein
MKNKNINLKHYIEEFVFGNITFKEFRKHRNRYYKDLLTKIVKEIESILKSKNINYYLKTSISKSSYYFKIDNLEEIRISNHEQANNKGYLMSGDLTSPNGLSKIREIIKYLKVYL